MARTWLTIPTTIWLCAACVLAAAWYALGFDHAVVRGLLTLVVVQGLFVVGERLRRPDARLSGGWRHLRPGFLLWFCSIATTIAVAVLSLVYVGTDWSRYPRGDQSGAVLAMMLGFGAGALWSATQVAVASLRWNDEAVEQRTALFRRKHIRWDAITKTIPSEAAGTLTLLARDGTMIRVALDADGVGALLMDARRLAPALFGGDELSPARAGITARRPSRLTE